MSLLNFIHTHTERCYHRQTNKISIPSTLIIVFFFFIFFFANFCKKDNFIVTTTSSICACLRRWIHCNSMFRFHISFFFFVSNRNMHRKREKALYMYTNHWQTAFSFFIRLYESILLLLSVFISFYLMLEMYAYVFVCE